MKSNETMNVWMMSMTASTGQLHKTKAFSSKTVNVNVTGKKKCLKTCAASTSALPEPSIIIKNNQNINSVIIVRINKNKK